jgi:hypothetical protein
MDGLFLAAHALDISIAANQAQTGRFPRKSVPGNLQAGGEFLHW